MDNRIILEPMSNYMQDPMPSGGSKSRDGEDDDLPPLVENFRVDRDAKVVSKEVYEYLKHRHGVVDDPLDKVGLDQ
jgi:hypothetical protein